jgi:uncharacterized protein (TIGR00369 family)
MRAAIAVATAHTIHHSGILDDLRPAARVGSVIAVHARVAYAGRTTGLSVGEVVDAEGKLIAYTTSRMRLFGEATGAPSIGGTAAPPSDSKPATTREDGPDPYLRPIAGRTIDPAEFRARTGLEIVQAQIRGDLPLPPMHHLLGIGPTEATDGAVVVALPLSGWLATPFGCPQGGFMVLLADLAMALAAQTTLGKGERMASVDIKVNFLRPVAGDGSVIEARARVAHRGRSLAVCTAEIVDAGGRPIALATGSAAMLGA